MSDGFRTSDVSYVGRPKRVGCPATLTSLCTSGVISKILLSDVRQGSDVRQLDHTNLTVRTSFFASLCARLELRLHHRCRTSELCRTSEVLLFVFFSSNLNFDSSIVSPSCPYHPPPLQKALSPTREVLLKGWRDINGITRRRRLT